MGIVPVCPSNESQRATLQIVSVGLNVGVTDGDTVGLTDGDTVGVTDGDTVGVTDGDCAGVSPQGVPLSAKSEGVAFCPE